MRDSIVTLITALTLFTSSTGLAQSKKADSDGLVARLSYDSMYLVDSRAQEGSPSVCLALYRSGRYQILMDTEKGTEFLQGTLSRDQLLRVSRMLEALDFQTGGASLIRQGAESFEAEVHRSGETAHYIWVDPDHQRPFPKSAISVVRWLRNFKAQGASPLTLGEFSWQHVCPSEEPLLPLTAAAHRESGAGSCGRHRP
jgi:hypothetical protein